MSSALIHICGPIAIHSFGLTIAIGLLLFLVLALHNPRRKKLMPAETLYDIVLIGIPLGLLGGRALYVIHSLDSFDHWWQWLYVWDGGVSSLGAMLALLIGIPLYLRHRAIPVLPTLDLIALFVPIIHISVRIGCYLAGCCYGKPTACWIGVMREQTDGILTTCIRSHPTQLYSAGLLLLIFLILYLYVQKKATRPGQIFYACLILTSLERFGIDFLRGDQEYFSWQALTIFSVHQWISLGLFAIGSILMIYQCQKPEKQ